MAGLIEQLNEYSESLDRAKRGVRNCSVEAALMPGVISMALTSEIPIPIAQDCEGQLAIVQEKLEKAEEELSRASKEARSFAEALEDKASSANAGIEDAIRAAFGTRAGQSGFNPFTNSKRARIAFNKARQELDAIKSSDPNFELDGSIEGIKADLECKRAKTNLEKWQDRKAAVISIIAGVAAGAIVAAVALAGGPVTLGAAFAIGRIVRGVAKPISKALMRTKDRTGSEKFLENLLNDKKDLADLFAFAGAQVADVLFPGSGALFERGVKALYAVHEFNKACGNNKPTNGSQYDEAGRRGRRVSAALFAGARLAIAALELPQLEPIKNLLDETVVGFIADTMKRVIPGDCARMVQRIIEVSGISKGLSEVALRASDFNESWDGAPGDIIGNVFADLRESALDALLDNGDASLQGYFDSSRSALKVIRRRSRSILKRTREQSN